MGIFGAHWVFSFVLWHSWFLRGFFGWRWLKLHAKHLCFFLLAYKGLINRFTVHMQDLYTALFPSCEEGGRKRPYHLRRAQGWQWNCTRVRQWNNADQLVVQNVEWRINATGLCILCSGASLPHLPFSLSGILVFTLDIWHNVLCLLPSGLHKCKQETLAAFPTDTENRWR